MQAIQKKPFVAAMGRKKCEDLPGGKGNSAWPSRRDWCGRFNDELQGFTNDDSVNFTTRRT